MSLTDLFESVWRFVSYWYFRYLMVTELYMVERWERNTINILALVIFSVVWYFNVNYVTSGMSQALQFFSPSS